MKIFDNPPKPDKEYSTKLNRREAIALGASTLATSLSGCSDFFNPSTGNPETTPPPQEQDQDTGPTIFAQSFSLEETQYSITPRQETQDSIENGETAEYTIRLKSIPLHGTETTQLAQQTVTVNEPNGTESHTLSFEFPDELINHAQQIQYTAELTNPTQRDETEAYRASNIYFPFENEAEGEIQLETDTPYANIDDWNAPFLEVTNTQIWFNEPDDDYFNTESEETVELNEENYPTHWYGNYTDLQITAVIKYPVYSSMDNKDDPAYESAYYAALRAANPEVPERILDPEDEEFEIPDIPIMNWAVFNFDMADIEMIEARRWNSYVIQLIEQGRVELSEDGDRVEKENGVVWDTHHNQGGNITNGHYHSGNVDETPTPFEEYYRARYEYTHSPREINTSPIKFAGGRPVMKRWAIEMEDKLANNTNFQLHDHQEYYKATILKILMGDAPYAFGYGEYLNSPEEVIINWYENDSNDAPVGGNCVAASGIFSGIWVHLSDYPVALEHLTGDNINHIRAAILGFDDEIPDDLPSLEVGSIQDPITDDNTTFDIPTTWAGYGDEDWGRFTPVECNYSPASIGYEQGNSNYEVYQRSLETYADEMDINSHIPVNEDYEPDVDGEILADREDTQNALEFVYTVTNPTDTPVFEIRDEM